MGLSPLSFQDGPSPGTQDQEEAVGELSCGLLVVQGTEDETNPPAEAEKLVGYARQPKAFVAVPGATHLFSRKEHAEAVSSAINLWLHVCGVGGDHRSVEE